MIRQNVKTKTTISVAASKDFLDDISFIQGVMNSVCSNLTGMYPDHKLEMDWHRTNPYSYAIEIIENGTVDYYPSNNWYEPDDYEDETTLCEDDFSSVLSYLFDNDPVIEEWEVTCETSYID